jgi:hypothetical protein
VEKGDGHRPNKPIPLNGDGPPDCVIIPPVSLSASDLRKLLERLDSGPADAIESDTVECKTWDGDLAAKESQIKALREA